MTDFIKPAFVFFLFCGIPAAAGGWLAANRARSVIGWALLCGLFPVFLLVIYFHKPLREVEGKFRLCPNCREFIKWREPACKYCQTPLP
jgi:hypothetical protein